MVFRWVEGSCGKGAICFLCLLGIELKLQCEKFDLGTRENLPAAGIVEHRDPNVCQQRFSSTEWFRCL